MDIREGGDIGQEEPQQQRPQRQGLEKPISALFDIFDAAVHTRTLEEFYSMVHRTLAGILRADNFFIALHDPARNAITFPYYTGKREEMPMAGGLFSEPLSLAAEVMASGRSMIFFRDQIQALARQKDQLVTGTLSRIWAGAPLTIRGRVAGVMAVQDYNSVGVFGSHDLNLLNIVSRHVALAIEGKEAETRIRAQGEILEKIADSSPVGMAMIENRVFKWVNKEMVRMFGYASAEAFGNRNVNMIYGDASDFEFAGQTLSQECASQGEADYEMDLVKKDGSRFPVHVRLNSTDRKDPMSRSIVSFTDISRRRAAEQETVERERLQGGLEMAGAVCHEINPPLQAIMRFSERLLLNPKFLAQGTGLDFIKSQAGRLGKITSTLANITRYKTVDDPGKARIVDIWGAGPPKMK